MSDDILAGGTVLWRPRDRGVEIVLVHRPRYDDWSLPKGKTKNGEPMPVAAIRETWEETGVTARLGAWLRDVRYPMGDEGKLVRYWSAEACTLANFTPGEEIDELRWLSTDDAADVLSYGHDVDVVQRFAELGPPTSMILLVRHAKAGSRDKWDGDDTLRPLSRGGRKQAQHIAELLRLFGPDRIVAAPLVRCRDTVVPLADAVGLPVVDEPLLTETSYGVDPDATMLRLGELTAEPGVTVIGSQGGVIPGVVEALARQAALPVAVDLDQPPASKKGSNRGLRLRDRRLVSADYVERADE